MLCSVSEAKANDDSWKRCWKSVAIVRFLSGRKEDSVRGDGDLSSAEPAVHGKVVLARYFFFCFLGGVTGRPVFMPSYTYFCFFSAGFKIYEKRLVLVQMPSKAA